MARPVPTDRMEDIGTDGSVGEDEETTDDDVSTSGGARRPGGIDEQDDGGTSGGGGGGGQSRPPGGIGGPDDEPDDADDGTGERSRPPGPIGGPDDEQDDSGMGGPAESRPPEPVPSDDEPGAPEQGEESRPPEPEPTVDEPDRRQMPEPEQGVEAGGDIEQTIQDRAQAFEQEVISQREGLEAEDVRVTRDGDTLQAGLTRTGQEVVTAQQLGLTEQDISFTEFGGVTGTTETGEAQLAIEGISAGIEEQFPEAESFSIQQEEPGVFDVEVETPEGTEQFVAGEAADDFLQERQEARAIDASRNIDRQVAKANREVVAAQRDFNRKTAEEFGDVPIRIPESVTIGQEFDAPTGTTAPPGARGGRMGEQTFDVPRGGERFENVLGDLSEGFSETIREATEEGTFFGESATAEFLEATGRDELAENIEDAGRDFLRGAGEIANVPEVAVGAKEAGEFVGFGAGEIATGEGSEFAEASTEAATERAQALAEFAEENPAEFGGTLAGSLIGSTAIMGAAGRVGTRTGLASRAAIQPGEEALGFGGNIATRAVATERTAERLFPDNEPLIFSEEAAIRGARAVGERAQRTGEILTGERPLPQTPFSRELTELGRPGGSRGVIGDIEPTGMGGDLTTRIEGPRAEAGVQQEAGAVGAPSEPLGGATEDILDRLYPTETETETGPGQSIRERTRSVAQEFAEDEAATARLLSRTESRQRGVTESEVERQEDRVSDNLYQQAIDRQVRAETEALEGTIESPETRFETRAERRRAATEPEVRTETETEFESRTETRFRTEPGLGIDTRQDAFTDVFGDVDTRTGLDVDTELATELGTEFETETETELEQELETELEPELELEPEAEAETEFETEFEAEVEPETEVEAEAEPEIEEQQDREEELLLGLEDIEERFGTGIASVEDLLEDT